MKITYQAILLPIILILEFVLIVGISLLLAALNTYYRDAGQLWDITLQMGFFMTPIFYSISIIPERYVLIYSLNPMTRVIESIRKILYYDVPPTFADFVIVLASGLLLLAVGCLTFRRLEPKFAELI
jgi:ABC-type polysaccharide/polyol phosphate export permease